MCNCNYKLPIEGVSRREVFWSMTSRLSPTICSSNASILPLTPSSSLVMLVVATMDVAAKINNVKLSIRVPTYLTYIKPSSKISTHISNADIEYTSERTLFSFKFPRHSGPMVWIQIAGREYCVGSRTGLPKFTVPRTCVLK